MALSPVVQALLDELEQRGSAAVGVRQIIADMGGAIAAAEADLSAQRARITQAGIDEDDTDVRNSLALLENRLSTATTHLRRLPDILADVAKLTRDFDREFMNTKVTAGVAGYTVPPAPPSA